MGGFFGVASKKDCIFDLFFGVDYHSHLGTKRGGMAVYSPETGFNRQIHNIENSPFRTKFEKEVLTMKGNFGIGCISDTEPQPLIVRSHHGTFAITTVGKINNIDKIVDKIFIKNHSHFLETSSGINATELVAALINQKDNLIEGIRYAQKVIDGSITMLLMNEKGIYAARDRFGRTPLVVGKKEDSCCVAFEEFSYLNLGYSDLKELGPGEIDIITPDGAKMLAAPGDKLRICSFLWVYYGYPSSKYEGQAVEKVRYNCGMHIAKRDNVKPDIVAGVPDSGIGHAIGYSNQSHIPYARPFVKYTPTWPRSFMPTIQEKRNLIAKMKLIPIRQIIEGKNILLIDDSIVRGTQMRETTEYLYSAGAKDVHVRSACPPILYACKYLNFSRSTSDMDLIARRVIAKKEGTDSLEVVKEYLDPDSVKYNEMVEEIRQQLNFTTLRYNRIDDLIEAIGIDECKICTYCFNGKE
ncbi:MAG: amidophosphoribosyltransferase [Acholeplasmatales bacterium]|nr:amidophosphoribosyltransferase [Acholeplasmatales bacterium]